MEIPKLTDADKQRFRGLIPQDPRVTIRPMFANLGAYVNGNMFAGTFGPDIGVKLDAAGRDRLLAAGGTPFGPPERPMGGYTRLPTMDDETSVERIERALSVAADLPAKQPAPRRVRQTTAST